MKTVSSIKSEIKAKGAASIAELPTLGHHAQAVIQEQYRHLVKQDKKVLADKSAEPLHQMRVGSRRLETALCVFGGAIELPKAANLKHLSGLRRVLGKLRDLDVQIESLQENYRPQLNATEQAYLDEAIDGLRRKRRRAFVKVESVLTRSRYQRLKTVYTHWLEQPKFTALAELPLLTLLPDLLTPLLSSLLMHPGWLVPADAAHANATCLHDLRKLCKHVRYQGEFFTAFYDEAFQGWIEEVRSLQDNLGQVQDGQVLLELLSHRLSHEGHDGQQLDLQRAIDRQQQAALADWEPLRQKYLNLEFRRHLHQMILSPVVKG